MLQLKTVQDYKAVVYYYVMIYLPIIKWRFFVVKWWKAHTFEMATITLLTSHHNPHCTPLGNVERLNHIWDLVAKCNCTFLSS